MILSGFTTEGEKLAKKRDVKDMRHYRGLVKEFLNEVVTRSHSFSRENFLDRRGRQHPGLGSGRAPVLLRVQDPADPFAGQLTVLRVLSGTLAWGLEEWAGVPAIEVLAGVAFVIGWVGNRWTALRSAIVAAVEAVLGRRGAGQ